MRPDPGAQTASGSSTPKGNVPYVHVLAPSLLIA
jgi:hypothetical protein